MITQDSVPHAEKPKARQMIRENLKFIRDNVYSEKVLITPRINGLFENMFEEDVNEVVNKDTCQYINGQNFTQPLTIIIRLCIPKVDTVQHVQEIDKMLSSKEKELGLPDGHLKVVPQIESTISLVNMKEIFQAGQKRMIAAAFGADDFTADFQVYRSDSDKELDFARKLFAVTCHAYGIISIDTPYVQYKDMEGLKKELDYLKSIGMKAKFAIHPTQIDVINSAFVPSQEEVDYYKRMISTFEEAKKQGKAAVNFENKMVDIAAIKRASVSIQSAARIPGNQFPVHSFAQDLWHPSLSKKFIDNSGFIIVNHERPGLDTYVELLSQQQSQQTRNLAQQSRKAIKEDIDSDDDDEQQSDINSSQLQIEGLNCNCKFIKTKPIPIQSRGGFLQDEQEQPQQRVAQNQFQNAQMSQSYQQNTAQLSDQSGQLIMLAPLYTQQYQPQYSFAQNQMMNTNQIAQSQYVMVEPMQFPQQNNYQYYAQMPPQQLPQYQTVQQPLYVLAQNQLNSQQNIQPQYVQAIGQGYELNNAQNMAQYILATAQPQTPNNQNYYTQVENTQYQEQSEPQQNQAQVKSKSKGKNKKTKKNLE
eukprot:403332722